MDVCQSAEDGRYNFNFIDKVGQTHSCIDMNKKWAVDEIGKIISRELIYAPDHVYYNDSVESNIKQIR